MWGLFIAGLIGKGANSLYKEAKWQGKVAAAGDVMLVNCKTPEEVIHQKCLWHTSATMPRLTDSELRYIEKWYKRCGMMNPTISNEYFRRTGKILEEVAK